MPVWNLYSYREQVAAGSTSDVFIYDELPKKLRVQISLIWKDAIGGSRDPAWQKIHDTVAREHGVLALGNGSSSFDRCTTYLLNSPYVNKVLDLIEFSFFYIDKHVRYLDNYQLEQKGITVTANNAIQELNERFRRAVVGYQFEDGRIFRIDSELIHSEIVQPVLRYLHQRGFEGPRDEFLQAHGHYRAGETKDAITDANNAFESTLKVICDQRDWQYSKGARASDLLKVVRKNNLLPDYLDDSFDQLVATLKSGLPKMRNESGAHGQGAVPCEAPDYVAAYALHLAAANILFLAEAHEAMK